MELYKSPKNEFSAKSSFKSKSSFKKSFQQKGSRNPELEEEQKELLPLLSEEPIIIQTQNLSNQTIRETTAELRLSDETNFEKIEEQEEEEESLLLQEQEKKTSIVHLSKDNHEEVELKSSM